MGDSTAMWLDLDPPEPFVHVWLAEFPQPDKRDRELYDKVREYHLRTEAFDRILPHFRTIEGCAIPANSWARVKSLRYASRLFQQLREGFTRAEWIAANSRYLVSRDCQHDMASMPWPYPPES